jgi:serine/threonine-protein kinase
VPLNIVHRDISPANLLVSYQGEIKLTDFGIAKAIVKGMETQAGVVKGRFDYMAPEQAAGGHVDHRADLFAAGVVFYELLTGRHPFRQAADLKTLDAVRRGEVIPPSRINPDVPAALDAVVAAALQVDPDRRYASATLFKDALNQFFHDAGFIFSAATLATFVRGLFPPEEAKPVPPDAPKPATKTADQDTGPIARPPLHTLASRSPMLEDATLIRKPEFEAIEPAPASQWSDLETVIRPDPFAVRGPAAAPPLPPRTMPPPSIGRPAAPRVESKPLSQPVEPRRLVPDPRSVDVPRKVDVPLQGRTFTESKSRIVYRTANHVHLVYVALCFAAMVAGLGCGVLLGRSAGAHTAVLDAPPAAEILAPAGSTAWLDGKPLVGVPPWHVALVAGVPAVVRVQGLNFGPVDAHVELPANQMRVLDFTPLASAKVP